MEWTRGAVRLLLAAAVVAIAWLGFHHYDRWGTVFWAKAPPKIERCGREWTKSGNPVVPRSHVPAELHRVATTPGGSAVLSPAGGCPTTTPGVIWVQLGPDRYEAYGLSGGP
jgi:hypothetical protein